MQQAGRGDREAGPSLVVTRRRRVAVAALVVTTAVVSTACSGSTSSSSTSFVTSAGPSSTRAPNAAVPWSYGSSYSVTAPSDRPGTPAPTCGTSPMPDSWVTQENARQGSTGWRPRSTSVPPRVPLYLDRPSTTCGVTVTAHLGGRGASGVVVRAYRVGWYGGAGARLVWTSPRTRVSPGTLRRAGDMVPSPSWTTAVPLPVGASWPPGLYLVETVVGSQVSGVAGLVVGNPAERRPGVVMYSNLTWTAYSTYGGASLYVGSDGRARDRATQVAVARPTAGPGLERMLVEDVPVAQLLDRLGLPLDPTVDTDVDTRPSLLAHRAEVVLPGHSEYWTRRMYDAFTAARNEGANIVDLGANEIYWQARVTYGAEASPTTMVVARTLAQDPLATTDPNAATVEWRSPPLRRDPAAVIGPSYAGVRVRGSLQVRSVPPWLQGIPGLAVGDLLSEVVRNEADGARAGTPHPDNIEVIALGALRRAGAADKPVTITYYSSRAGGGVFAGGTTYWPCLVVASCPDASVTAATRETLWQMTSRVLDDFAQPQWGATHPSQPTGVPTQAGVVASLPPAAVGSYGTGD